MNEKRKENKQQRNERYARLLIISLALVFMGCLTLPAITKYYNLIEQANKSWQSASDNDEAAVSQKVVNEIGLTAPENLSYKSLEQGATRNNLFKTYPNEVREVLEEYKTQAAREQGKNNQTVKEERSLAKAAKKEATGEGISKEDEPQEDDDSSSQNEILSAKDRLNLLVFMANMESGTGMRIPAEPETVSQAEVLVEPETESQTEVQAEPETVSQAEVQAEPETVSQTEVQAKPETVSQTEVVVEPETEPQIEATAESEVETISENGTPSVSDNSVSCNNIVDEIYTTKKIHLYESPDENSERITVKKGEVLNNVTEVGNGWLKVTYKGKEWYVYYLHTDYAEKAQKEPIAVVQYDQGTKIGRVTGRSVNLRSYPGITSKVIGGTRRGEIFQVLGLYHILKDERYGWYLLKTASGKEVFIYALYFKPEDELTEKEILQYDSVIAKNYGSRVVELSQQDLGSSVPVTEENINYLTLLMVQEAGGVGMEEMGYCGQVAYNRARMKGKDIKGILSEAGQYPNTWSLIQNGQVAMRSDVRELATQILSGTKNGFEGSPYPRELWDQIYYQSKKPQTYWKNVWYSGSQYYGTN